MLYCPNLRKSRWTVMSHSEDRDFKNQTWKGYDQRSHKLKDLIWCILHICSNTPRCLACKWIYAYRVYICIALNALLSVVPIQWYLISHKCFFLLKWMTYLFTSVGEIIVLHALYEAYQDDYICNMSWVVFSQNAWIT